MVQRRKHIKHKRRLARPRSGLKLDVSDLSDMEYWSFPLPPISPSTPNQSGIRMVQETVVKVCPSYKGTIRAAVGLAFARNS